MVYHLLPPELWGLVGDFARAKIFEDLELNSIVLVRYPPKYYTIHFDRNGEISHIERCRTSWPKKNPKGMSGCQTTAYMVSKKVDLFY